MGLIGRTERLSRNPDFTAGGATERGSARRNWDIKVHSLRDGFRL
jgi:hypothetical protein